jgi:hypothetical protein
LNKLALNVLSNSHAFPVGLEGYRQELICLISHFRA